MSQPRVLIVGGGLAGLACARHLTAAGIAVRLFETSDEVGGRVRTDRVDGFLLDRGFQVLLSAYPECRRELDYAALDLAPFFPGALVRYAGRFHSVADPFRQPIAGLLSSLTPIGTLFDKLRVARLRGRLLSTDLESIFSRPETTTLRALAVEGFSSAMIERFFRPFLGGIFLESDLTTSSRMFEFVFKMFSSDSAVLPAEGMQAIPRQLAAGLPAGTIASGIRIEEVDAPRIRLESGEWIEADAVVVAAAGLEAVQPTVAPDPIRWCATTCLYYSAPEPPIDPPTLVLDGDKQGPVNNLCVPSQVAPSYAPADRALVSATVIGSPTSEGAATSLDATVRTQLREWFGPVVEHWELLRIYQIPQALPMQPPPWLEPPERPVHVGERLYICGDYRDNASIQGAMVSGRRAAESVLEDL